MAPCTPFGEPIPESPIQFRSLMLQAARRCLSATRVEGPERVRVGVGRCCWFSARRRAGRCRYPDTENERDCHAGKRFRYRTGRFQVWQSESSGFRIRVRHWDFPFRRRYGVYLACLPSFDATAPMNRHSSRWMPNSYAGVLCLSNSYMCGRFPAPPPRTTRHQPDRQIRCVCVIAGAELSATHDAELGPDIPIRRRGCSPVRIDRRNVHYSKRSRERRRPRIGR